jgi:lysyl-tRNA synthetase class II
MTLQILESLSKSLDTIRSMLKSYQLLEVFTPILHNRCDFPSDSHFPIEKNDIFQEDMFLRICMELRLRQLLEFSISCGVYEIGACFRKEYGVGRICEFQKLELFEKSPSYDGLINQIFEIVKTVHKNVCDEELNIDAIPVTDLVSKAEIDSIRISTKGNDKEFIKFFESSLDTRLNEINKTKLA